MAYKYVKTPEPVYVKTATEAKKWAKRYSQREAIGFDTETTGLSKVGARIKFFSFADSDSRICAPVRLLGEFQEILEDPDIRKRMTNSKFDMHMCANHGVEIRGVLEDTVVMDWLVDENRLGRHGLKQCSYDYLGLRMAPFKDVFGNVGAVDKEVQTLVDMHDALEAEDEGAALELLTLVGQVYGEEDVVTALKKISKALSGFRSGHSSLLTASAVLSIARKHKICPTTRTRLGYVSDFLELIGLEFVPKGEREQYKEALQEPNLLEDAHETVLDYLKQQVHADIEPLAMLELLVGDYASLDAWASFTLVDVLNDLLSDVFLNQREGVTLQDYYYSHSAPFLSTLWNMERRGISLDEDALEKLKIPMGKDLDRLERDLVRMAGWDVNPNSSKQLLRLFFTKDSMGKWRDPFGKEPRVWTKGGSTGVKNPSTNKDVINEWADRGEPLAVCLREHRVLKKLHGTYLTGLPKWTDSRRRIHTDLKAHGTVTGRLASGDPNLQNIPSRGEWGPKLRKLFVAGCHGDSQDCVLEELRGTPVPDFAHDQEMTLIVADYEQLEMRIMAHMSQDPTMIDTIREGKDLHSMTAALAGGYDYDEIVAAKKADKPTDRQKELIEVRAGMKAVGFGLLYGIGSGKLGAQLGLPMVTKTLRGGRTYDACPEAQDLIDTYFDIYPDVKDFIDLTRERCEEELYVQTIMGRYRRLPDILSDDKGVASRVKRQSVNSIIQGSAADITIEAMLKCERDPLLRELGVRMLLQIHDELVFEVPKITEVIPQAKARVRELMENPIPMSVPIIVSMDEAGSWGEAK